MKVVLSTGERVHVSHLVLSIYALHFTVLGEVGTISGSFGASGKYKVTISGQSDVCVCVCVCVRAQCVCMHAGCVCMQCFASIL